MIDISLEQFQAAAEIIRNKHLKTPLVPLHFIQTAQGHSIWLKLENLQPSGSFKIRGATYCISKLSEKQKKAGVIAYSTGNHAQAVALAAHSLGIQATIVMSEDVPKNKVNATREFGATIVMAEPTSKARQAKAEALAKEKGFYLVPPCEHPDIITGQGTIAVEILETTRPAAVFVPIGGGGLIAGIAMALKKSDPSIQVIGVEPELENDAFQSFHSGKRVALPGPSDSIADAIKIQTLGDLSYPLVMHYVDDIVTVTEAQIVNALILYIEKAHLIVEPSGALALAAALSYKRSIDKQRPIVCIASGGNTLLSTLCNITDHG